MQIPQELIADVAASSALHTKIIQNIQLQDYMVDVFDQIDSHSRVLIFTPHMVGKTHGLAAYIRAYMTTQPASSIITTAPTHRQVKDLLWKEIAAGYNRMVPEFKLGQLNQVEWTIEEPGQDFKWFAKGFSVQKKATTDKGQGGNSALQGYHNTNSVLAIGDECIGLEPVIWGMLDGILTGPRDKFVGIGNPTTRNCEAYRRSKQLGYHVIFIKCFDTPNFIANGITSLERMLEERDYLKTLSKEEALAHLESYVIVVDYLIHVKWGMLMLLEKGESHPDFQSKVIGVFPDEDSSVLIPEHVVRASLEDSYEIDNKDKRYIGVDVAREGNDSTVFTEIIGWQHTRTVTIDGYDTAQVVLAFMDFITESEYHLLDGDEWPNKRETTILIDPGYNPGVYDALRAILDPWTYHEQAELFQSYIERYKGVLDQCIIADVPFGGTAFEKFHFGWADEYELDYSTPEKDRKLESDKAHYTNIKAKMFDQLADDLRGYWWGRMQGKTAMEGGEPEKDSGRLCLHPDYEELYIDQLPTILMVPQKNNESKKKIESKVDYKERTGQGSPDESDSLALANLARYHQRDVSVWG